MNYHNITYPDMNNGDGLRVVLWLSSCSHHCYKCQNPQTWDVNSGISFDDVAKEELFKELEKDYISGLTLTGGDPLHETNLNCVLDIVTEFNRRYKTAQDIVRTNNAEHNMLNKNANEIRLLLPEKNIWLYTGYYWEEIFEPTFTGQSKDYIEKYLRQCEIRKKIISKCDVIVDGRYIDSQRDITLKWRGSKNQRVISVKESLEQGRVILYCD